MSGGDGRGAAGWLAPFGWGNEVGGLRRARRRRISSATSWPADWLSRPAGVAGYRGSAAGVWALIGAPPDGRICATLRESARFCPWSFTWMEPFHCVALDHVWPGCLLQANPLAGTRSHLMRQAEKYFPPRPITLRETPGERHYCQPCRAARRLAKGELLIKRSNCPCAARREDGHQPAPITTTTKHRGESWNQ